MIRSLVSLLFVCLFLPYTFSQDAFEEGLKHAQAKNYTFAIREFKSVLEKNPENQSAIYNLGNCYLHNKENGKAIWQLEKFLKLNTSDEEAMTKIDQAYMQLGLNKTWKSGYSTIDILLYQVGPNTWVILSIILSIALSWIIFILFRGRNSKILTYQLLLFVLLIACLYSSSSAKQYVENDRFAIVTKKSIPVYANDLGELTQNSLSEGTRVEIISSTKTNLQVRLESGKTVLIKASDVQYI